MDRIVIDLVAIRRQHETAGGNVSEFQKMPFPSVQSLLNPTYETAKYPVTSTIVNNIIHVMTVPTLPEQISILYLISKVIRWQISPTENNYESLPDWLRPTEVQLATEHPAWIDLVPWPMIRERMCKDPKYYPEHVKFSDICNESMSINWPHRVADMVMQVNGSDTILNPIFERHVKNIRNWTVGPRMLEE